MMTNQQSLPQNGLIYIDPVRQDDADRDQSNLN